MRMLRVFWSAILAGVAIALGGAVFLSVESKLAGSFLFGLGLFVICSQGWHLYTGKIGTLFDNKPSYLAELGVIWLGNLAGTLAVGFALRATRVAGIAERAASMCSVKVEDDLPSVLLLSILCGLLVQIAVMLWRKAPDTFAGVFGVLLPIAAFILCGFEHCVANMFYFTAAGAWSLRAFGYLLVMTLGNSLGGLLIPGVTKLLERK